MTRRIQRFSTLIVLALSLLRPSVAWAWGTDGHIIVAEIAYQRLSLNAKRGVRRLLDDKRLFEIASWPDEIRKSKPETGPWHYVDIEVEGDGSHDAYKPEHDCPDGNCVIEKIKLFHKVLADENAPREKRAEALKYLVHFVGDIHQPLHCADRPYRNHDRDKGGNLVIVRYLDEPGTKNLHSVWDSTIIEDMLAFKDQTPLEYADDLARKLDHYPPTTQVADWQSHEKPEDCAAEAHKLAVEHAYKGIPVDQPRTQDPQLDEKYVEEAKVVIEEQLEKAGVRLADLLNKAFP